MPRLQRFWILVLVLSCTLTWAQKPHANNAKVEELSAASGFKTTVDGVLEKHVGPLWIGYRIPAAAKERSLCCFGSLEQFKSSDKCCGECKMESEKGGSFSSTSSDNCALEPLPYAFVFLRVSSGQIGKIRVYSAGCALDFNNLPLYWLENVKPEQSVDFLVSLTAKPADEDRKNDVARQAVMAIALHDTPAADAALEKMIQPGQPLSLRENVAFWLGVERGKKGLELLRKYVKDDPDDRLREKSTFAFSQSKEPEALKDLIGMARHDPSPRVRSQAIFWLAQIGGKKEAGQITEAIENDPETEVKKKAVFALSQMHDADAVPRLIQLVRSNRNPVVRKQALFWLGQTHDPRALDFLEEILTK